MIAIGLLALRFSILSLVVAMLCGYRSRANYEHWLTKRRPSQLTLSRNQHSLAETAFAVGRIALWFSLFCIAMHALLPVLLGNSEVW